jgi:hypothetical protein
MGISIVTMADATMASTSHHAQSVGKPIVLLRPDQSDARREASALRFTKSPVLG